MEATPLLSIASSGDRQVVQIHGGLAGLLSLHKELGGLIRRLKEGECDRAHLRTADWAGAELSKSMLAAEREQGAKQVQHLKIDAWSDEWRAKHAL
jgi:hypothetical protein